MPRHEYRDPPVARDRRRLREGAGATDAAPSWSDGAPDTAGAGPGGDRGRIGRPLLAALLILAGLVPFVVSISMFWGRSGEVATSNQAERDGVAYLRPLVRLVAVAADQQTLDVAGTPGSGQPMRSAMRDVDLVDARLGTSLEVHDRWVNVRQRSDALLQAPPPADSAAQSFGQVIDLLMALISSVGDRSTLILDPELDTYYLMDATLIRLPAILVSAGRLNDQARTSQATRAIEMAVLVDRIRQNAEALDIAVRKSSAATQSATLAPGLVSALDRFGDSVSSLAMLTADRGGATDVVSRLGADRNRVRDSGLALEEVALNQLDTLLTARWEKATGQRRVIAAITLFGLLLAGLTGWLLFRLRSGRRGGGAGGWRGQESGISPQPAAAQDHDSPAGQGVPAGQDVPAGQGVPAGPGGSWRVGDPGDPGGPFGADDPRGAGRPATGAGGGHGFGGDPGGFSGIIGGQGSGPGWRSER
jgi:hypothetical protein